MKRRLPVRPTYGPTEWLEAFVHFRSLAGRHANGRDLQDARQAMTWYRALADDLAAGRQKPASWTAAHAVKAADAIHAHCGRLGSDFDHVDDVLADRRAELGDLRALTAEGAQTRERLEFLEERLEFLEIEQTRIMVQDVGAGAFLSGLVLGSLAAVIGAAPFVTAARAVQAGGAKGGRAGTAGARAAAWQQELETARDADPEHFKLSHAQAKIARRDGVHERTVRRYTTDPRRGQ